MSRSATESELRCVRRSFFRDGRLPQPWRGACTRRPEPFHVHAISPIASTTQTCSDRECLSRRTARHAGQVRVEYERDRESGARPSRSIRAGGRTPSVPPPMRGQRAAQKVVQMIWYPDVEAAMVVYCSDNHHVAGSSRLPRCGNSLLCRKCGNGLRAATTTRSL